VTFDILAAQREWKPIHNCPGRYRLAGAPSDEAVEVLVGTGYTVSRFRVEGARDEVLVVRLDKGGVISYARPDGKYVHTLNDPEGFTRKLAQLGISVDA
jgi:hypothetical protein